MRLIDKEQRTEIFAKLRNFQQICQKCLASVSWQKCMLEIFHHMTQKISFMPQFMAQKKWRKKYGDIRNWFSRNFDQRGFLVFNFFYHLKRPICVAVVLFLLLTHVATNMPGMPRGTCHVLHTNLARLPRFSAAGEQPCAEPKRARLARCKSARK